MSPPPYVPTPEELAKHKRREVSTLAAHATPFPGPLREAFAGWPRAVGGVRLEPLTAGHLSILQRINSPFLSVLRVAISTRELPEAERAAQFAKLPKTTVDDEISTLFVFSRCWRKSRAILDGYAPEFSVDEKIVLFKRHAMDTLADNLGPMPDARISEALGEHYMLSFAAKVNWEADKPAGDRSFTSPAQAPETASAG